VAARHLREALDRALREAPQAGFLAEDREEVARLLLHDNAARLYPLRDA